MASNNDLNTGVTPLIVVSGGTGIASTVAYAPIVGGTTSTAALQTVASVGTTGQLLQSQGSAIPQYATPSELGTSPVKYEKITLSSSDITGMYVTPKLLVSAGGSNTLIIVYKWIFEVDYNSVAYTGGGNFHIQWDSTTLGAGTLAVGAISTSPLTGTTDTFSTSLPSNTSNLSASTTVNKGLHLSNVTAAFATGNSTCYVHIYYSVLSTTI